MFDFNDFADPVLEWQLEGVSISLYATMEGYLLAWNDYVANDWVKAFSYLSEAVGWITLILIDTETHGVNPSGMNEIILELHKRNEETK